MFKKSLCLLLAILTPLMLTGCWNNRDITDIGIVTGCGVDISQDGRLEFTVQIISQKNECTSASSSTSSGGNNSNGSSLTVTAEGNTIFEAARNLIPMLSKKAYYAQVQVVLIGEQAARQIGLSKIWDFFERDHEFSRTFSLLVVKNGTAESVLEASSDVEQLGSVEILDTVSNSAFGKNVDTKAFRVSDILSQTLTGLVSGVIDTRGSHSLKDMKIEGAAIFRDAKLVDYLDGDQTRGYVFAFNAMQSTILLVDNPKEKGNFVSLEVISSTGKTSAKIQGGKLKLTIGVQAKGNIGEEQGSADLTDAQGMKILQTEAEQVIAENVRQMMNKSQKELDCDILDFNDYLYKHDYAGYEKIKSNWNELFRSADVIIQVKFLLVRPGIVSKPAYDG